MAISAKRRTNTATFTWKENSIDLRAEFAAMELLSEEVGMDAIDYINAVKSPRELCEVFFHLQYGSDYERDVIYDAFFSSVPDFFDTTYRNELMVTLAVLLGGDKATLLAELAALNQDEDTPKKSQD